MDELNELIDELVVKRGPYTGYIKKGQDPDKVGRLVELGYNEPVRKEEGNDDRLGKIEDTLEGILKMLSDHEKRIAQCSIRR